VNGLGGSQAIHELSQALRLDFVKSKHESGGESGYKSLKKVHV
jgi:hypothetical protein